MNIGANILTSEIITDESDIEAKKKTNIVVASETVCGFFFSFLPSDLTRSFSLSVLLIINAHFFKVKYKSEKIHREKKNAPRGQLV